MSIFKVDDVRLEAVWHSFTQFTSGWPSETAALSVHMEWPERFSVTSFSVSILGEVNMDMYAVLCKSTLNIEINATKYVNVPLASCRKKSADPFVGITFRDLFCEGFFTDETVGETTERDLLNGVQRKHSLWLPSKGTLIATVTPPELHALLEDVELSTTIYGEWFRPLVISEEEVE